MNHEEALETAAIASIAKQFQSSHSVKRPFRAPYHTASGPALVGRSKPSEPGEISSSHHGVLFLDELSEFKQSALETLRDPLESRHISISRAGSYGGFPAKFLLIPAMNPCPCGFQGAKDRECMGSSQQIQNYLNRIPGPLLDRIDLHLFLQQSPSESLFQKTYSLIQNKMNPSVPEPEKSAVVQERVVAVRERQYARQGLKSNNALTLEEIEKYCQIGEAEQQLLTQVIRKSALSARSYHRILKGARTIADLASAPCITQQHLLESLSFRLFDRALQEFTVLND